MKKDKIIKMVEIELDLDEDTIERLLNYASQEILKDKQALLNYGVNLAFTKIVETEGKCLKRK